MNIQFDFSIYPSVARRGQHAVAISNGSGESLVIGFTESPDEAKEAIARIFSSDVGWSHDETVDYHTMRVVPTNTSARSS